MKTYLKTQVDNPFFKCYNSLPLIMAIVISLDYYESALSLEVTYELWFFIYYADRHQDRTKRNWHLEWKLSGFPAHASIFAKFLGESQNYLVEQSS